MSNDGPKDVFAREAAVVELGKLLATKRRGDRLTAAEIQKATGWLDWSSFRGRIFTWAKRNGFVPFAVRNDGWRFGTASEHVDFAERRRRSALKHERRGMSALISTPRAELDDAQERRTDFAIKIAARRLADAERDEKSIASEFKLTERVPLRSIAAEAGKG